MASTQWQPWHQVVKLRDDLRTGELSLSLFAADLYEVARQRGSRRVYEDPHEFFALTYPTHNLRELAKDVAERLEGRSHKAVRQLELTYGGGKTHALITLYHLARQPAALPDLPAVHEFLEHIGFTPSPAMVAVLPFDKLDVEKGMEVAGPDGSESRWLRQPWSVLAYQIAGSDGLRLIHAEGLDEERVSAPAENLLRDLLSMPGREGKGTLVLIDEVLMFAREKIGFEPAWRGTLLNFFQYLTQAATGVDRCAVVASLLATDPRKSDTLGKELTHDLYAIFRREREQAVEPVVKEDVAEVLRRRFFTPESIGRPDRFKPHVVAGLKGLFNLDEQSRRAGAAVEDRFLRSYPFHPDLTEVLYSKWTQLEGFQRTRGVLRTFALALRDAEAWDESPFVGPAVFLGKPNAAEISDGARELTIVAGTEEYEGKRQEWAGILQGELGKARAIQEDYPALKQREVEQAVLAIFLHSQPIGHKAVTRDLWLLVGPSRPDRIELEEGLKRWTDISWFLDEASIDTAAPTEDGRPGLPREWRLGTRPNLKQIHHDAVSGLEGSFVEAKVLDAIASTKSLSAGASAAGARVHLLPGGPRDVEDDGELHLVILGPKGASDSGKPSAEAERYITQTTGPDRPRVYQNAIVVVTPSRDGLAALRIAVQSYLGWEEVRSRLREQELDPVREQMLAGYVKSAKDDIPAAARSAYSVIVTLAESGDVQAFRMTGGDQGALFAAIKADPRARIQEAAVNAEAMLPGGPYDLWREGEVSRPMRDLVGAFAQFPYLPKMLSRKAVIETVAQGCQEGLFVLSARRPDGSRRTWWRIRPDDVAIKDPSLEVVLPDHAELASIEPAVLAPGVLPGVWTADGVCLLELEQYFVGGHVVMVPKDGYEEPLLVPCAKSVVIREAVGGAVAAGLVWLWSPPASLWCESVPPGVLNPTSVLRRPPEPVSPASLLQENLPNAWEGGATTGLALASTLSSAAGVALPWELMRRAIDDALRARFVELAPDSGAWPCDLPHAQQLKLRVPSGEMQPPGVRERPPGVRRATSELRPEELQDLADCIGEIVQTAAGLQFVVEVTLELGGKEPPQTEILDKVNAILGKIHPDLHLR